MKIESRSNGFRVKSGIAAFLFSVFLITDRRLKWKWRARSSTVSLIPLLVLVRAWGDKLCSIGGKHKTIETGKTAQANVAISRGAMPLGSSFRGAIRGTGQTTADGPCKSVNLIPLSSIWREIGAFF
jgi:hypothetical protein